MAVSPQLQPARATAPQQKTVAPDYVMQAQKADAVTIDKTTNNPIYKFIFEGSETKEAKIAKTVGFLTAGLQDGTAKSEDFQTRRQRMTEINAMIQVVRRQLGSDAAKEIMSKVQVETQRITNETTDNVREFEGELDPLIQLAELFAIYGAKGNIIQEINKAKEVQRARQLRLEQWMKAHDIEVSAFALSVSELKRQIAQDEAALAAAWFGKNALEAKIANGKTDLAAREQQLAESQAKNPPIEDTQPDTTEGRQVDENILKLQDIGGQAFRDKMTEVHEHTEITLAKISIGFDEVITAMNGSRETLITMDRNCSDAALALSILEVAVQQAETITRQFAEEAAAPPKDATTTSNDAMAALDRMEQEQRSEEILAYTASLTTFQKDLGLGVASLRKGQAGLKSMLLMNALALESNNTHKLTGMANTADAVTITIASIIEICNRAASRLLADGLTRIRQSAEDGSTRLAGGTTEAIEQQNDQLQDFITSLDNLKTTSKTISSSSVEALKRQFELVTEMRVASEQLGEATTDAERTNFNARAGVGIETKPKEEDKPVEQRKMPFGLRSR